LTLGGKALPHLDDLLRQVTRPARYTGGEWNSIVKDWEAMTIRIALSYPDVYEIGMSNIALPILYDLLNRQPDVLAERVFAPWVDMADALRARSIPLFSLESRHPLRDFDVIGFSLGYEMTYTNVLNMLHLAQIPLLATEREDAQPVVIAGGSGALNPEPMADFIDAFVVGDGEEALLELLDVFRARRKHGASREALLRQAATIPGIYVPGLYRVEYRADGALGSFTPTVPEAEPRIRRRIVSKLPPPPTNPVVPYIEVVHDRGFIEIQRGCSRGCRFCQAGAIYRPVRERPQEEVVQAAGELISKCGYDEISLVSLSTSDYGDIDALVADLARQFPGLALSLPSMRLGCFALKLMGALPAHSKTGLTFAPEAGSERLRGIINKRAAEEEILDTAATAFERGWTGLKLYFMLGLPGETIEDVEGIARLVDKIRSLGRKVSGRTPHLRISASTFVPKPHTPFQWVAQEDEPELAAKLEVLKRGIRGKGVRLSWSNPDLSRLEAVLSRGDRRLGRVIQSAWELGAIFDAWNEHFRHDRWLEAFGQCGLDPDFYARRQRSPDELLPWAHVDIGVTAEFLKREHARALQGMETPDCRHDACSACGLQGQHPSCPPRSTD
jgi:radical SAM family uncharacterized protein